MEKIRKGNKTWSVTNTGDNLKKKKIRREYPRNRYHNMSKEDKQKLREHKKIEFAVYLKKNYNSY